MSGAEDEAAVPFVGSEAEEPPPRTLAQEMADNEHQMYQRSRQHIEEIEAEVRETQELCAKKEPISALVQCYDPETSRQFYKKAVDLSETYSHIRRIRGDGNCFYRAVLTAMLDKCFEDRDLLTKFAALCRGYRQKLIEFGFPELTSGDFCDAMDNILDGMIDGTKSEEFVHDDLNNDNIANYYVAFLRLVTSQYLRANEELYSGFIEGIRNMDQYCKDEVEPMWKECEHLCVIALINAIDVPIRIEYMDQTSDQAHHDIPEDREPILFFLYRPGHYDILYKKS